MHHGRHAPETLRRAAPDLAATNGHVEVTVQADEGGADPDGPEQDGPEGAGESPVVIRVKEHEAVPMTIDQALYAMELVGHDFFLYVDADCGRPERGLPAARLELRRDPAGRHRRCDRAAADRDCRRDLTGSAG